MANEKYLALLRKGVIWWNQWRENNTTIIPDFSCIEAEGKSLSEVNFWGTNLRGGNFKKTYLIRANLSSANLSDANLSKANLINANLINANLCGGNLGSANLSGANFSGADLSGANLREANLSGANLSGANLGGANLHGAILEYANLKAVQITQETVIDEKWRLISKIITQGAVNHNLNRANLSGAILRGANLSGANLSGANLSGANLSDANLSGANLSDANLSKANLSGVNLSGVNFRGINLYDANLSGVNFSGTNLSGVNLRNTNLSGANLSEANFKGANFSRAYLGEADFNKADLSRADFSEANLIGANLSGANLSSANLECANLKAVQITQETVIDEKWRLVSKIITQGAVNHNLNRANLSGANLSGTNLSGANLSGANLSKANLSGVNFKGANLSDANLTQAILYYTNFTRVNFKGADLSEANLVGATLDLADLSKVNFKGADLSEVNLRQVILDATDFSNANLSNAYLVLDDLSNVNLSGAILSQTRILDLSKTRILEVDYACIPQSIDPFRNKIEFLENIQNVKRSDRGYKISDFFLMGIFLYTEEDYKLSQYIQTNFEALDELSSDLCIVFLSEAPPLQWRNSRHYWKEILELYFIRKFKILNWFVNKPFNKNEIYDIARELKIEVKNIPCFVLLSPNSLSENVVFPILEISPTYFRNLFSTFETIVNDLRLREYKKGIRNQVIFNEIKNQHQNIIKSLSQDRGKTSHPLKTILILASNPKTTISLRLDEEVREIDAGLQRAKKRELFEMKQLWAVRVQDVYQALLNFKPQFVHFSGHGSGDDGLVLEDETGNVRLVDTQALASLFKLFASDIECVVLNACYSEVQADAISQHIPYVIGMKQAIGDKAAIKFATGFYNALGAGESVEFAYKLGCNVIQLEGIPEHLTPDLKKKPSSF